MRFLKQAYVAFMVMAASCMPTPIDSSGIITHNHTDSDVNIEDTEIVDSETNTQETDTPDTQETDTQEVDDTDAVDTDVQLPVFPPLVMTELVRDQLCVSNSCLPGWSEGDIPGARPVSRHPAACTVGGWNGPADRQTVCLFDLRFTTNGERGAIRVVNRDGTFSIPPDGKSNLLSAGLAWAEGPITEINYLHIIDIDGDGQVEVLAASWGLLFRRQTDNTWLPDERFNAAWHAAGFRIRPIPAVWDIDGDGRLDILLMALHGIPWTFYQLANGDWEGVQNFTRIPGAASDVYAWKALPGPDGSLRIFTMGSPEQNGVDFTGVFLQTGVDAAGRPMFEEQDPNMGFNSLPWSRPMGGLFYQLTSDDWPELLVATSSNALCFGGYTYDAGVWYDASLHQLAFWGPPVGFGAKCAYDLSESTREIAWEMQLLNQWTFVTTWGDDARGGNGDCPANPECPIGGEPITAHLLVPGTGANLGAVWSYPIGAATFRNQDGSDAAFGNARGLLCRDMNADGDSDCVMTGLYEGLPRLFWNDSQETGSRFCGRVRGSGAMPWNGTLTRVTVSVGGVPLLREHIIGQNNGLDDEFCVELGNEVSAEVLLVPIRGPSVTRRWVLVDGPNPVFSL